MGAQQLVEGLSESSVLSEPALNWLSGKVSVEVHHFKTKSPVGVWTSQENSQGKDLKVAINVLVE